MGRYSGKKCRLMSMFSLTGTFFLVEIVVGYLTNSMALVADSFHMLSDIAALLIAFLSVKMAPKSWSKNTYGWARAEVLGALINAVFLVALCFSITVESLKRFYEKELIHQPQMILSVGVLGLIVNLLGLCLFHEHGSGHSHGTHSHLKDLAPSEGPEKDIEQQQQKKKIGGHGHSHGGGSQMNMRGVFLHVLADALGSVVVIISALIMWLTEWEYKEYVDPGLSLVLVVIMMYSVWPLLIESALILLQTVPTHLDIDQLKKKLLENIDGILAVHDFHVWQLTGDRIIASAHIRCLNLHEYMKVAENVKEFFHNEGIHSTTIQPEFVSQDSNMNEDCAIGCPKGVSQEAPDCQNSKCCLPQATPSIRRRPSSLQEDRPISSGGDADDDIHGNSTSTPARRSAPNLSAFDDDDDDVLGRNDELTAEIDLSDQTANDDLGVTPLENSHETTPMFTPRSNSRVVRIVSKQSNV